MAQAKSGVFEAITLLLTEAAQNEDWQRARELVAVHARLSTSAEQHGDEPDLFVLVHPEAGALGARITQTEAEADLSAILRHAPGWAARVRIEPWSPRGSTTDPGAY